MFPMFMEFLGKMSKNGGDDMITKDIEALIKLRDAFRMAAEALDEYVDSQAPKEVAGFTWNPKNIKWTLAEGTNGPYERSEDINSLDFKEMMKDLVAHNGKFQREEYFYWAFERAQVVGRKKKVK